MPIAWLAAFLLFDSVFRSVPAAPVLLAAGDIASCDGGGDEATALLLDAVQGTIVALGDTVYPDGTADEYRDCFDPSWGRHRDRIRPVPGNHEYHTDVASPYFDYFGEAAGDRAKGYYSFVVGSWHVVALNTECEPAGGCGEGSPQYEWLRHELAESTAACTIALMHTPRFSSGPRGESLWLEPFWDVMHDAGVELVLSGDDHHYERFAPQGAGGEPDPVQGLRQFVVGTGGIGLNAIGSPLPNSEARNADSHGLLRLALHPSSYEWQFLPVQGRTFTDTGSEPCHEASRPKSFAPISRQWQDRGRTHGWDAVPG